MKTTEKAIWIVGDMRSPRLWLESLKVMTKAAPLAREAETPLHMILLGSSDPSPFEQNAIDLSSCVSMEDAAREALDHGAHAVLRVDHKALTVPHTQVYAGVLEELVSRRRPWLVLFPLNDFNRELAAFCAQTCRAGMIADCSELVLEDGRIAGRCPAWGGRILANITLADEWTTAFVTVQPQGVKLAPERAPEGRIENAEPEQVKIPEGMALTHRAMESPDTRRLEEARIVVVGGAGMGDMRGFSLVRDLAASLGGEVGATRPPVLYHWVEENRMIGQTGKTVRPELLFSIGTSGAVQYTAGITEARTIVAVNRDANAPIFELADVGMVGDASVLLPLLTKKVKQVVMRRLADAVTFLDKDEGLHTGGFGALVRRLREARNWTAEELARKTGQTPDFISQVETDQMSPPVGFIINMARAMEVDPGTFLNKEERSTIRDLRVQAFQQRTRNYSYTTLTPDAENSHLRAFMVTIDPHQAHKPVAYKHEGEEFIFVLGGELEFTLGSRTHVLKEEESIHFNSDIPHKLKSLSGEPTRCLVVLYTI